MAREHSRSIANSEPRVLLAVINLPIRTQNTSRTHLGSSRSMRSRAPRERRIQRLGITEVVNEGIDLSTGKSSTRVIVIAFLANLGIAVAKFVGAFLSGSAA